MNIEMLLSVIIGGVITWWVARHYFVKASNDLRSESEKLIRLTLLIHRALEDAGLAEFSRDEEGNIVGMKYKIPGSVETKITPHANMAYHGPTDQSDAE